MDIRWHLIGHLQSNKARKAAEHCAADSLGRQRGSAAAARRTRRPPRAAPSSVLVQVDLALEATKHGAPLGEVPGIFARGGNAARRHSVVGLMLLPPLAENPEDARALVPPAARGARSAGDERRSGRPSRELSMGMSHDFEVAIEEGATMVRVGSAIFGNR